jgi:integrase/recombinase XerD
VSATTENASALDSALDSALGDYLAHLRVERGLSANTTTAYRRDLARYTAYLTTLGRTDLGAVGPADVGEYVTALREGSDGGRALSAASAARALAAVRGLHRFAQAEGLAVDDPSARVTAPSQHRRLPHALSVDAVARLLEAASAGDTPAALRDRALLELLYSTGGRISEVVGLDVDDVTHEDAVVRLLGKGSKERIVPVGRLAREALAAYLAHGRPALEPSRWARRGDAEAIFLNQRGGRLTRQGAWLVLKEHAHRVGLGEQVSPHVLRHSCATHMLDHGADIRIVQELLGHASISTTQVYTKVSTERLWQVYDEAHPRATR